MVPLLIGAAAGALGGGAAGGLFGGKDKGSDSVITSTTDVGNVTADSVEAQAAQRRLARLSKYFTSPTGIMTDPSTGSTGVFA